MEKTNGDVKKKEIVVPEGMKMDSKGRFVDIDKIKQIDLDRDDTIDFIFTEALELANVMDGFRKAILEFVDDFVDKSKIKYDKKLGGVKGNLSLVSYSGLRKITVTIQDKIELNEQLTIAKDLVFECMEEWSEGSNENLKTVIRDVFALDNKGNMKTKDILHLRTYSFDDERWEQAMQAIVDSILITSSKRMIRIYSRDTLDDAYKQMKLDLQ